jgi:plastocyanin
MLINNATTILVKVAISQITILIVTLLFAYPTASIAAQMQEAVPPQQIQQIAIAYGSSFLNNTKFYDPSSVSVPIGIKVNWTNNDVSFHTVTFVTKGIFDSGIIPPGNSTSNIFSKQGIFNYYCKIHPYMIGELTIG